MIMMLWNTRTSKYPHKIEQDETTSPRAPGLTSSCLQDLFSQFPANPQVLTQNMGSNSHHHFHPHLGHSHPRGLNKYLGCTVTTLPIKTCSPEMQLGTSSKGGSINLFGKEQDNQP